VGAVASIALASVFGSLSDLGEATTEKLQEIDGVGPNTANAVVKWFDAATNQRVLDKLRSVGFWPTMNVAQNETFGVLSGTTIVITGTLKNWSRKEAIDYIESHGGIVRVSITSKTSYLLVGKNPGSKLDRARNLGVPEIDVNGLRELAK
jgi:DNA ligase (NAD+)